MTRTLKERTFSGTTNPEIQPWEIEHRKLARLAAAEGIVLLKNEEHVLPLKQEVQLLFMVQERGRRSRAVPVLVMLMREKKSLSVRE